MNLTTKRGPLTFDLSDTLDVYIYQNTRVCVYIYNIYIMYIALEKCIQKTELNQAAYAD